MRRADYLRGGPAEQRAARVAIERELRRRRELLDRAQAPPLRLLRSLFAGGRRAAAAPPPEVVIARRRRQFGGTSA